MDTKNFLKKLGNFTPCFDFVTVGYPKETDKVLGKIWRYTQMRDGVCKAGIARIAEELGISYPTVERRIKLLKKEEFIIDLSPELRHHPHTYTVNEDKILKENEVYQANKVIEVYPTEATKNEEVYPTDEEVYPTDEEVYQADGAGLSGGFIGSISVSDKDRIPLQDSIEDSIQDTGTNNSDSLSILGGEPKVEPESKTEPKSDSGVGVTPIARIGVTPVYTPAYRTILMKQYFEQGKNWNEALELVNREQEAYEQANSQNVAI